MQKRSHKLLADTLLRNRHGFSARRFELAFLFGSFQPDCNPFTYLRGVRRTHKPQGHNFISTRHYIDSRIRRLQRCERWGTRQYYTLGKLTHYLADAFTYPHNDHFPDTLLDHHRYETELRQYLADYLSREAPTPLIRCGDLSRALETLHKEYIASRSSVSQDVRYILRAMSLLMAECQPAA